MKNIFNFFLFLLLISISNCFITPLFHTRKISSKKNLSKIKYPYCINDNIKSIYSPKLKDNLINTIYFSGWLTHQYFIFNYLDIYHVNILISVVHILVLIWQYVGLFIISHDLHHSKTPSLYKEILGRVSLLLYGGFILEDFSKNHNLHHLHPGIDGKDPDFSENNIIIWYLLFMKRYLNIRQLFNIGLIISIMLMYHVDIIYLYLFWTLPSILASIQLFFYGTYLVHEKKKIINSPLHPIAIYLTSYNFGYHEKHHHYPEIPWYELDKNF